MSGRFFAAVDVAVETFINAVVDRLISAWGDEE